jgi:hypothetical protein
MQQPARKAFYGCNCKPGTKIYQSCVEFWGKKCPFCGLEMVLLPRDTKKKLDRDEAFNV